ncbi:MAG TPA: serine hydrolase domain-containing protein [Polyangia bacterium]|nr:serine hydrolase domain-containing protein [Polyangia bacterium]
MARLLVGVTLALVATGCAHGVRATDAPSRALAAAIDALATDVVTKTPAAGVSVAVMRHGRLVVAKGYGFADVAARTAVTPATIFRIGSITKQLTAAAIVQLAQAQRLTLDDDIHRWLPDYPTHAQTITLRQLLTHTSGIPDFEHHAWFEAHMAERRPRGELVASFGAEPLEFTPGAKWSYSSSGYYLLGLVVERASGRAWADYVRDQVLAPAGVRGIGECPDTQDYPHAARGYDIRDGKRVDARPIVMAHAFAAGALCATAPALVDWARALAGGRVVGAAGWREMTTPVTLADGSHFGYGLGLFIGDLGGHRVIFHGGGVNGFVSALASYPDDDLVIAVLVNTEGDFADALSESIARVALNVPRVAPARTPLAAGEGAALAGRYEVSAANVTLVVEVRDDQLVAHKEGDPPSPLARQADGSFVADNGGRFVFHRDGARVTGFTYSIHGAAFEAKRLP